MLKFMSRVPLVVYFTSTSVSERRKFLTREKMCKFYAETAEVTHMFVVHLESNEQISFSFVFNRNSFQFPNI